MILSGFHPLQDKCQPALLFFLATNQKIYQGYPYVLHARNMETAPV